MPPDLRYSFIMKRSLLAALLLALAVATAHAQEPAHHNDMKANPDAMPAKPPTPPSTSVNVTFAGKTIALSVEDLLNLPQVTLHVHNEHSKQDETYSGPLVSDVLAKAGLEGTEKNHALILHSSIVATGTDNYFVLYSGGEVEPLFSAGKVIVAVMQSGLPINSGGAIKLVNTFDNRPARWVQSLTGLNVMTLAPTK